MFKYQLVKQISIISLLFVSVVYSSPLSMKGTLRPSEDPFYMPDAGFENTKPGDILKTRVLPSNSFTTFSALPQKIQNIYQFLYRSTDSLGNPIATVTTLMVPKNADPTKLVSYQMAEDSNSNNCAPSFYLQNGTSLAGPVTRIETLLMNNLLARGWYVNTPDYEGPDSYFTVGVNAGNCVLDSIRAVLSTVSLTKLHPDAQVQLWGYSGGAHASAWATQLYASYSPELPIIGAAFGGTPVDVNASFTSVNKTPFSGLNFACMLGLSAQYSDWRNVLDQILLPNKKQAFMDASNYCLAPLLHEYKNQDISSYFNRPDFLNNPIATRIIQDNTLGKMGTPKIPIFMYHSSRDEVIPIASAISLYNSWCASSGASIQFMQHEISGHFNLGISGAANAINFLIDGFNGKTRKPGCSKCMRFSSALDPGSIDIFGKLIYARVNAELGRNVGPNDLF